MNTICFNVQTVAPVHAINEARMVAHSSHRCGVLVDIKSRPFYVTARQLPLFGKEFRLNIQYLLS